MPPLRRGYFVHPGLPPHWGNSEPSGELQKDDSIGVRLMRKLIVAAFLTAGLALSACNTVSGAGKDMQSAGEAVTETANDAK